MRRADKQLSPAGDKNVCLFTETITQLFPRLWRLDIAGYFYVIVLAFISAGRGDVREDPLCVHAAVTHIQRAVNPPLLNGSPSVG